MKLDSDPFPVGMVEIKHKKILVWTGQAETTKVRTWSFPINDTTNVTRARGPIATVAHEVECNPNLESQLGTRL
jgi:hypothetical protein